MPGRKRLTARRRGPNRFSQRSSRSSSILAHDDRRKKYDRPRRVPAAYAVIAPRTLPRKHTSTVGTGGRTPAPARKQARSMVLSPGTGGKTYSSQARSATRRRPPKGWARSVWWIASLTIGRGRRSDPLDEIAEEGDCPALAAHRLDHADQRQRHIEEDEVDEREGEQPGEHPRHGGENGADEDHPEEGEAGHAAEDQALLGVPADIFPAGHHERHERQDPHVREDEHDLVLVFQIVRGDRALFGGERVGRHGIIRAPGRRTTTYNGQPRSESRRTMDALTPMLRQYRQVKSEHPDAILMFRLGDFYEMFYDDALVASRALSLTLTARGRGTGSEAPMCGVPYHAADGYIARLIGHGYRVAVCDQVEDARQAKGIVRRAVTRVISPGTFTDPAHLQAREPNYIAAVTAEVD